MGLTRESLSRLIMISRKKLYIEIDHKVSLASKIRRAQRYFPSRGHCCSLSDDDVTSQT
jgi:hypothetical protein